MLTKNILKYAFILLFVASLSAGIITLVYKVTKPTLDKRKADELDYAINTLVKEFYPTMNDDYVLLDDKVANYDDLLNLFEITLEDGQIKYVYNIEETGKNGAINYLVCFSQSGEVENIIFISQRETPGRGDKITSDEYINEIVGQTAPDIEVPIITGATLSSNAIDKGVTSASNNLVQEGLLK